MSKYGVLSGPYFPAFGLNTESYSVALRFQSECGKIRSRKTPYLDTFQAVIFEYVFYLIKVHVFVVCPTFTYRLVSSDHIKTKSDANCNLEEIIGQEVNNLGGGRALFSFVSYSVHWVDMYFFFDNFHVIVKLPGKVSALL